MAIKIHYNKNIVYTLVEEIICKIDSIYIKCFHIPENFKRTWFESIKLCGEYTLKDCIKDNDGYWRSKEMNSTDGLGHITQYSKFIWRIEPNYCTLGKPHYTKEKIKEIFEKSETKKYIFNFVKSQICLEWDGFNMPTETRWGLYMKDPFISIYENEKLIYKGISIYKKGYKKHLLDFLISYYT